MVENNLSAEGLGAGFLSHSIKRLEGYKQMADKAIGQLDSKQLFFSASPGSNSIAVIMRHMGGNMLSRWTHFLTEDGEKSWRNRDQEFEPPLEDQKALLELWEKGWVCLLDTLRSLHGEDLEKYITIRGEKIIVYDAIIRQLMHYSSHVGQIVYLAKWLKGDNWQPLTIPKNQSAAYNQALGHQAPKP